MIHPISNPGLRQITQRFGEHPEWYANIRYDGVALKGHNGIDFGLPIGTPIVACDAGRVAEACEDPAQGMGYGIYAKVIHPWGESLYAHLSELHVAQGDTVRANDLLGLSGNTGNSTGPHLHFGLRITPYRRNDGWGGYSDPQRYLDGAINPAAPSGSKAAWHFQGEPTQELADLVNTSGAHWVKRMDPSSKNWFPNLRTIGRVFMDDSQANELAGRGAVGGEEWFRYCLPFYRRAPYVRIWEFVNESPVNDIAYNARLAAAIVRWSELMRGEGLQTVGPVISVGNPGGDTDAERKARLEPLLPAFQAVSYWAYHAYWVPDVINQWYALRYRMIVSYLHELGLKQVPDLLLTEAGIDGGIYGQSGAGKGFRYYQTDDQFLAMIGQFDDEVGKDDYAQCFTLFTSIPAANWWLFNVDLPMSRLLAEYIKKRGSASPTPTPPPVPSTVTDETLRNAAWNALGIARNPDAAFAQYARGKQLGRPVTNELRHAGYALQGFDRGIVACLDGDWGNIREFGWE